MLPLAHIYIATKVLNQSSDLLVFGSVLPDLGIISMGKIEWRQIHSTPDEFYSFMANNYPDYLDLAIGLKTHSDSSGGLDHYSDDEVDGYAIIFGKQLLEDIKKNITIPNGKNEIIFAHNFIEAAVDLHLSKDKPEILNLYRETLQKLDRDKVSEILSKYLKLDQTMIRQELDNFTEVLSPDNLSSIDNAVNNIFFYFYPDLKGQPIEPIVQKSLELTRNNYQEFLDQTVEKINKPAI